MNNGKDLLRFKWTVSKGMNTYGYNICSLYVNGNKKYSCVGGGYDMEGTVFANYLVKEHQDRLMLIQTQARRISTQEDNMQWKQDKNEEGLYGMSLLRPKKLKNHICLDGGCGMSSMQRIAEHAGLKIENFEKDTLLVTVITND